MAEKKSSASVSVLPEGIIHQILSRLEHKEAIRASLLSKAWLSAYQTKPILLFQNSDFSSENRAKNMGTLSRYREQKIGIDRLEINLENNRKIALAALVDQWIQVAVENGVRSLKYSTPYTLPQIVFQSTSLVELKVCRCELKLQETEKVKRQNLQCLQLSYVRFDDTIFEKIVSSCQCIETLDILDCTGFKNLNVTKLAKLKRYRLYLVDKYGAAKVEVGSSSLEYFECDAYSSGDTDFEIDVLGRLALHACPNLKSLTLSGFSITYEFFFGFGSKFPQLEDLKLIIALSPRESKYQAIHLQVLICIGSRDWWRLKLRFPAWFYSHIEERPRLRYILGLPQVNLATALSRGSISKIKMLMWGSSYLSSL